MNELTEAEKKLWQCYHARAMQALLTDYQATLSIMRHAKTKGLTFGNEVATQSTDMANCMLDEAKKRGCV